MSFLIKRRILICLLTIREVGRFLVISATIEHFVSTLCPSKNMLILPYRFCSRAHTRQKRRPHLSTFQGRDERITHQNSCGAWVRGGGGPKKAVGPFFLRRFGEKSSAGHAFAARRVNERRRNHV